MGIRKFSLQFICIGLGLFYPTKDLLSQDTMRFYDTMLYQQYDPKKADNLYLTIKYSDSNQTSKRIKIFPRSFKSLEKKVDEELLKELYAGYLKASYRFDTIIASHSLDVHYNLFRQNKYKIDSIRFLNASRSVHPQFIAKLLWVNRKNYKGNWSQLIQQIKYIDFLEFDKNPDFTLRDSTAILNIYLKERKVNQFNAILGIQSNSEKDGSVQFTGDVKLSLSNIAKRGVAFNINWQKNLDNSQFLYSNANIPFIFSTNFGLGTRFHLEKFDTSYTRLLLQLNWMYQLKFNQSIGLTYRRQTSSIEGINSSQILSGILPNYLDFALNEYGVAYKVYALNRPFFPKSGYKLDVQVMLGNKSISINNRIAELVDNNGTSMRRLYDSIPLSQTTFSAELYITKYTSLSQAIVWLSDIQLKLYSSQTIKQNELFYFGGNKKPRGFDDNSLTSSQLITLSNELQYYLTDNFYSNIFVDISAMKNTLSNEGYIFPIGTGLGLSIKTNNNIFNLNFAVGKLGDNNFSLGNTKVHINYTNVF